MKSKGNRNKHIDELKSSLADLISEYQKASDLINDQMQAVIYSDLVWLDSLVEEQLAKYESLQGLEEKFKEQLEGIFQDFCPEENQHSLTLLMEKLEQPSKELNRLRNELHEQVEKTQKLREQLMDLLHFAREHNVKTFEEICQLGDNAAESYSADGKMNKRTFGSVAINQKA
ncbi:MAG: flagellar export chaperone FlgN [Balneolaceae bacterium]|jgi:hypothetical protein